MFRKYVRALGFVCLVVLALAFCGCGAASSSAGGSGGSSGVTSYAGAATLGGVVSVSGADLAQVSSTTSNITGTALHLSSIKTQRIKAQLATIKPCLLKGLAPDQTTLEDGIAKLYELTVTGGIKDTGITTNVLNGNYQFEGIKDGLKYVVEIIKVGYDSNGKCNILKQRTYVNIPAGEMSVSANVTQKTGVILNAIIQKIMDVAKSNNIPQATVDLFIQVVADSITDLINQGLITVVSNVEVYSAEKEGYTGATASEEAITDMVVDQDSVKNVTKEAELAAKARKAGISLEEAKKLISDVLGVKISLGDSKNSDQKSGGVPSFFVDIFAKSYKEGKTITIRDFAKALNESIPDFLVKMKTETRTPAAIQAKMVAVLNNEENSVRALYAYYDAPANSKPSINVPVVMKAIFPTDKRISLTPVSVIADQALDVCQVLVLMGQAGYMDSPQSSELPAFMNGKMDGPGFDPMRFLNKLGWLQDGDLDKTILNHAQIMPVQVWNNTTQTQVEALQINVGFQNGKDITKVTFTYTKASDGAQATAELQKRTNNGQMQATALKSQRLLRVAAVADDVQNYMANQSQEWYLSPWNEGSTSPTIINDYRAGEVVIKAYAGATEVLSEARTIIKVKVKPITWAFPKGPNMVTVESNNGFDNSFEPQYIAVDPTTQKARISLSWSAAEMATGYTLPAGHKIAYMLNLGLASRPQNGQNTATSNFWRFIWSSWDQGSFINTNTYLLPKELSATGADEVYEVNVTPLLINTATQEVVWQGYNSRTEFKVGTAQSWAVALKGTITFNTKMFDNLPKTGGSWKIGLFKMAGQDGNGWKDYFNSATKGARVPISQEGGSPIMVATLGTTEAIKAAANNAVAYTLPTFSQADKLLSNNTRYRLIVWYDQAEASPYGDWTNYGAPPTTNGLDYCNWHPIETHEMLSGEILLNYGLVRYEGWGRPGAQGSWKCVSDGTEAGQTFDFTVGSWYK